MRASGLHHWLGALSPKSLDAQEETYPNGEAARLMQVKIQSSGFHQRREFLFIVREVLDGREMSISYANFRHDLRSNSSFPSSAGSVPTNLLLCKCNSS